MKNPPPPLTPAELQALRVGDTLQGREVYPSGGWHDARRTLVRRGDICIWMEWWRTSAEPRWSKRGERANWSLMGRPWYRVQPRKPASVPSRFYCPVCGLGVAMTNEGCCATCGATVATEAKVRADLGIRKPGPRRRGRAAGKEK
mgnify:CR=1 FL=1